MSPLTSMAYSGRKFEIRSLSIARVESYRVENLTLQIAHLSSTERDRVLDYTTRAAVKLLGIMTELERDENTVE